MEFFLRVMRSIYAGSALVAAGCIFILMFWGTAGVVSRYIFNYSLPALYEASSLLLVLIVYLAIAQTQSERGNIRIQLVISRLKGRRRELVEAIGLLLSLIVFSLVLWRTGVQSFISFRGSEFQAGIFAFPVWPSRFAIVVGFLFLCICIIIQIYEHLSRSRSLRRK